MHFCQKKNFFWIVMCIFQIYIKFGKFSKKGDRLSLSLSEVTVSDRRG